VVEQLRISGRDVARDALVESELPEEPEGRRQPLLAVPALVLDVRELGKRGEGAI
jgi:hypothetical protein